jgi:hypothetical protein
VVDFELVGGFPDIEQADGGVEAIEDGQRHGYVSDDYECPLPEELQVGGPEAGVAFDQSVDEPHRDVGHQQEGHDLSSRSETRDAKLILQLQLMELRNFTSPGLAALLCISANTR